MKRIEECTHIPESDRQLMADLKEIVLRFVPDAELLLYGSAARGEREPESDYDVLIILPSPISREEEQLLRNAVYDMDVDRGVVVSLIVTTRERWSMPLTTATPLYKNVEREGMAL